jgi:hypothetical protein
MFGFAAVFNNVNIEIEKPTSIPRTVTALSINLPASKLKPVLSDTVNKRIVRTREKSRLKYR